MHRIFRKLNPFSVGLNVIKIGGGLWAYKYVMQTIEVPWQRWLIFGVLALCGIWAPLAAMTLNILIPDAEV